MMLPQVKQLCYQLRFMGVHESIESRSNEALAQQLHPLEFMRLLLEDEIISRKNRLAKTLTTRAKFRCAVDLEDWDTSYDRGINKGHLKGLAQLQFTQSVENLLIFGKTGEGKTHLAIALGRRICQEGTPTIFMAVNAFFEEVAAAKAAGKYLNFIRQLNRTKVLILDDFGMRSYTHEEATILLDVLEERYRKGPVIVTSQVHHHGWQQLFHDAVVAEAIVDRLLHPSHHVILTGGSYRERLGRKC